MAILLFNDEEKFNLEFAKAQIATGVPSYILKGIVGLESNFNPRAYRNEPQIKDASYGLCQTLVRTATGQGFSGKPEDLYDPYTSLLYGGRFIRCLAKKYPSVFDLIASYNMGYPRKITETTRFIADIYKYPYEYREKPPVGWVFANEVYVRRVSSYCGYYKAREEGNTALAEQIAGLLKTRAWDALKAIYEPMLTTVVWGSPSVEKKCPVCGQKIA